MHQRRGHDRLADAGIGAGYEDAAEHESRPPCSATRERRRRSAVERSSSDVRVDRDAQPRRARRHGRRPNGADVEPVAPAAPPPPRRRAIVVADHDGNDLRRPSAGTATPARASRRRARWTRERASRCAALGFAARSTSRLASSACGQRRRRRRREDERPRALDQVLDRPRRAGDERAADAERLARRVDRHEDVSLDRRALDQAASALARRCRPRALRRRSSAAPVDRQSAAYSASGAHVAVHAEQRFDDDEALAGRAASCSASSARKRRRRRCAETRSRPRRRQPDAVDQARVVALVREDRRRRARAASSARRGWPDSRSRNRARVRSPLNAANRRSTAANAVALAAQQPRAGAAAAVALDGAARMRSSTRGCAREPQVVVRGKIDARRRPRACAKQAVRLERRRDATDRASSGLSRRIHESISPGIRRAPAASDAACSLQPHAESRTAVGRRRLRIRRRQQPIAEEDGVGAGEEAERLRFVGQSDSRPALRRTNDAGIRMRAVAIVRTSSSGSSAGRSPSGVPSTRDEHVDRHALRMRIERRQLLQQAERDARDPRPCR